MTPDQWIALAAGIVGGALRVGVPFREAPRAEAYGKVAVFEDLYGNPWDLIEARR